MIVFGGVSGAQTLEIAGFNFDQKEGSKGALSINFMSVYTQAHKDVQVSSNIQLTHCRL